MSDRSRTLLEVAVVILLLGALDGVWLYRGYEQRKAVAAQEQLCAERSKADRALVLHWTDALVRGQAEGVFGAFRSGIRSAVLAGRGQALEAAVADLLRLPGVAFVHLLKPDGAVMVSSNQKYLELGSAGERGTWALGAKDEILRQGDLAGTTELAAPIADATGAVKAVLWMAYNTRQVAAGARPPALREP